jgi:signal transduction histidine kinase
MNSLAKDFLDILMKLPVTGSPDRHYQETADRLAQEWPDAPLWVLALRPLSGHDERELVYSVYLGTPHASFSLLDLSYSPPKILFRESPLLKRLTHDGQGIYPLEWDGKLKQVLLKLSSLPDTFDGNVHGITTLRDQMPVGFILTASRGAFLQPESVDVIKKVLYLMADKLLYLYEDKNNFQSTLSEIAHRLLEGASRDVEPAHVDVLQCVLDTTLEGLQAKKAALFLVDPFRRSLFLERAAGDIDFEKMRDVATYDIKNYDPTLRGTGVTPWVLHRKKPFNARNWDELHENSEGHWKGNWDGPMYGGSARAEESFQCVYMVPIMAGEVAIGVLKYENREPSAPPYFAQSDERVIDLIAELVASLVISQRIERNRYEWALPRISNVLVTYFGLPEFYEKLLEECRTILSADFCSLFLVDGENNLNLREIVGVDQEARSRLKGFSYGNYRTAKGLTPWILREKGPFNVRSYEDLTMRSEGHHLGAWDHIVYPNGAQTEFKSLYSIPLRIGDNDLGVFKVENKNVRPCYFAESDARLFDLIGRLIAVGVTYENERYLGMICRMAELGFLASGIAHEFNNYMQGFSTMADTIKKNVSDEKRVCEEVEILQERVKMAKQMIESFRQVRDRKQEVTEVRVDDLVKQMINFSKERFSSYGVTISYSNHNVCTVTMNESELQTILINLLKNAFEACMETGGKITLIIADEPNDMFSIKVADSGKGMSQDEIEHAYAPFFTTKAPTGTGLGLFMVHRIVTEAGGTMPPPRSPNEDAGTTISITLPRIVSHHTIEAKLEK